MIRGLFVFLMWIHQNNLLLLFINTTYSLTTFIFEIPYRMADYVVYKLTYYNKTDYR